MAIRAKTRRRLIILLLVAGALVIGLAAFYTVRKSQIRKETLAARAEGLAAFEAGDYGLAFQKLGRYLRAHERDSGENAADIVNALRRCAKARLELPEAKGEHIGEAISLLQRAVGRDPSNYDARREFVEILALYAPGDPLLAENAKAIHEKDPDDPLALEVLASVELRGGRPVAAFEYAKSLTLVAPERLSGYYLELAALEKLPARDLRAVFPKEFVRELEEKALSRPDADLVKLASVAWFRDLLEKNSGTPAEHRFSLLLANALLGSGADLDEAREILLGLAAGKPGEVDYIRSLVATLARIREHDLALEVLRRGVTETGDDGLLLSLAQRLWEREGYEEIAQRFDAIGPEAVAKKAAFVAMKAMALVRLGRESGAEPLVRALESEEKNGGATAWARFLREVEIKADPSPIEVLETCRAISEKAPGNPYFEYASARAQQDLGELALAANSWVPVIEKLPLWVEPRIRRINALLATGQVAIAGREIATASMVLGDDPRVRPFLWMFEAARLRDAPGADLRKLEARIRAESDGSVEDLPVRVDLLARAGDKTQAVDLLRSAFDHEPGIRILLDLAATSENHDLGASIECYELALRSFGWSPDLALAWARSLARGSDSEEGRELLARARRGGGSTFPEAEWDHALAVYLDALGDPEAGPLWTRLADAREEDPRIQRGALESRAAWADRGFIDRTIKRLKNLFEDGIYWRLARARWLLTGAGEKGDRNAADAVPLLSYVTRAAPDLTGPHLLLATALERTGNLKEAAEALSTARKLTGGAVPISLELVRVLVMNGEQERALRILGPLGADPRATNPELVRIAELLLRNGDPGRSREIMARVGDASDLPRSAALAGLLWATGQPDLAESMLRGLLDAGPDERAQELLARILLEQGRTEEARAALAGLEAFPNGEAKKREILARHFRRTSSVDDAIAEYLRAIEADPSQASNWQGLAAMYVAGERFEDARNALEEARAQGIGPPDLPAKKDIEKYLGDDASKRLPVELLIAWIEDLEHRGVAREAMDALLHGRPEAAEETARGLSKLADGNPDFLNLQVVAANFLANQGLFDEALRISSRATVEFPEVAAPVLQQANVLRFLRRWDEAIPVLLTLRERVPGGSEQADTLLLDTYVQARRPDEVVRLVASEYLDQLDAAPLEHFGILLSYTRALAMKGGADEAAGWLRERLPAEPRFRGAWISIARDYLSRQKQAFAWLDHLARAIPEDADTGEWLALAEAWGHVGKRFSAPEADGRLLAILDTVVAGSKPEEVDWLGVGLLYESCDAAKAIAAYRKGMEIGREPVPSNSANNLAMLLVNTSGDLGEAERLASRAVSADPTNPEFLDTLAVVHVALKQLPGAIESLREACVHEPKNPKWLIRLAEVQLLEPAGEESAKATIADLDRLLNRGITLPADLKERLDRLRRR